MGVPLSTVNAFVRGCVRNDTVPSFETHTFNTQAFVISRPNRNARLSLARDGVLPSQRFWLFAVEDANLRRRVCWW